ncbi:hypothetical protein GCM10010466_43270 [Planomonospora alba]|uniref:ABC transporter domain-containing protein n=1 Tax=Planomonospora alba TaxID=161354 RepID=A0ABP6NIE0_9ACTN
MSTEARDARRAGAAPAVRATATSKRYGDVVAVDGVSLSAERGQIYALLGLNGAGKTTLIRMLLDLPGASVPVLAAGAGRVLLVAALTCALATPLVLAASAGRGYLAAVGALFAALFCAQVIAALGYGAYFPWSVPGLLAGVAGPGQEPPGLLGHLLVALAGAGGALATAVWWQRADHTR